MQDSEQADVSEADLQQKIVTVTARSTNTTVPIKKGGQLLQKHLSKLNFAFNTSLSKNNTLVNIRSVVAMET